MSWSGYHRLGAREALPPARPRASDVAQRKAQLLGKLRLLQMVLHRLHHLLPYQPECSVLRAQHPYETVAC